MRSSTLRPRPTASAREMPRYGLPSWLISLVLHSLLLLYLMSQVPQLRGPLQSEFPDREVRLVSRSERPQPEAERDAVHPAETEVPPDAAAAPAARLEDPPDIELPPNLLELPQPPVLGAGAAAPSSPAVEAPPRAVVQGTAGGRPAGQTGGPAGTGHETTFFGLRSEGSRILYVIDASGSMASHNAMGAAKAELQASLNQLKSTQQFQILFYNSKVIPLEGRDGKPGLHWGTDINRSLARGMIDRIQPNAGTDHLPALKEALRYRPDVIYFLTDADQPELSARELDEIRTRNKGSAQIHTVEFGVGPSLQHDNFLKKLSRQNGGSHRYVDVRAVALRAKL